MGIPSRTTSADYTFSAATERDRLYVQFELYREQFRESFARALAKAEVTGNASWRALDVACGEGLYAAELVERYPAATVVGFDRDPEAIATATEAFREESRLQFHVADVHSPLLPVVGDGYDVAYVQFGLGHFRLGSVALREIHRTLRPGGAIMLLDPTEKIFDYPHPSCEVLVSVLRRTWPTYGTYAAGDRHERLLEEAGFVDIATEPQNSPLGGATRAGQTRLACLIQAFHSGREAFVERARAISASDFDEHLAKLTQADSANLEGTAWFRLAFARKP